MKHSRWGCIYRPKRLILTCEQYQWQTFLRHSDIMPMWVSSVIFNTHAWILNKTNRTTIYYKGGGFFLKLSRQLSKNDLSKRYQSIFQNEEWWSKFGNRKKRSKKKTDDEAHICFNCSVKFIRNCEREKNPN